MYCLKTFYNKYTLMKVSQLALSNKIFIFIFIIFFFFYFYNLFFIIKKKNFIFND